MSASNLKWATPDCEISEAITRRWSPYVFSDRAVSHADLCGLFEAARWAASSYNEQPWSYIVATKAQPQEFARLLSCLVDTNQEWAQNAPVLAIGVVALHFTRNNKLNKAAVHDLGAASCSLTFEATARGLTVHQMIGIEPERARELYDIPAGCEAYTGLAMGYPGELHDADEKLRQRDLAPRTRKSIQEFVFTGKWGEAAKLAE